MDNQFINSPLLVNRSGVYSDPKDELIKKLQIKNTKLKTELIKIQKVIEQRFGEEEQAGPRKRQSIFQHQENFEVLTKELANTYKRIKMYEYEINKLEEGNRSVNFTQKNGQMDGIIKEKKAMSEKLKAKFIKQQKIVQENIRKLSKDNQKEQLEIYMKKLTDQAKFYKEKVKVLEQKEAIKANNMKRQYQAIKKYQKDLYEAGVAGGELDQIKRQAVNSIKLNPANTARKTMQETKKHKDEGLMSGSEDEIEDRTREHYQALLAEVALLEKMQNDHEKQMVKAFDDKVESINKNMESRNRLLECQNEIQNLEKQIQIIKGKVVPSNMKPTKPLRSLSSHQPQNPGKLLPAKPMMSSYLRTNRSHQLSKINTDRSHHQ